MIEINHHADLTVRKMIIMQSVFLCIFYQVTKAGHQKFNKLVKHLG